VSHRPGRGSGVFHQDQTLDEASTVLNPLRQERTSEGSLEGSDPGLTRTTFGRDQGAAPACHSPLGGMWEQAGGDDAALWSRALPNRRGIITDAAGDNCPLLGTLLPPASVEEETFADQALEVPGSEPSSSFGDCAGEARAEPCVHDREVAQRGWDRQAHRRQQEGELRKQSVTLVRELRAGTWSRSTLETANVLGISPRTLWRWEQNWETNRLVPKRRGRPPQIASCERQAEVTGFLKAHGPSTSIAMLKAERPDIARAELSVLRADFRAEWQQQHTQEQCRLEWLYPGSVWAMDFTHPPHRIDGVFPAILNVRDLASHQQLLWLAVEHENAATVVEALADLFTTHGAPLVMKCDNGPAFRAHATKHVLLDHEVFTLYSPPYCARFNGACERANCTLKELTEHIADQAGRPGFWKADDLFQARLRANRFSRPWGATGATPEQSWTARAGLSLDKRQIMWQHLQCEIATLLDQRELDSTVALSHYTQTEIERLAAQPVLEQLGLLHVTRRRITPPIRRQISA
jgi:transposase InsO family protein